MLVPKINHFFKRELKEKYFKNITFFFLFLNSLTVFPHEFWIEPERWILEKGQTLTAHTKVGQHFKGDASPFIRAWFSRFELHASKFAVRLKAMTEISRPSNKN